jgi:hypothetical protein
MMKCKVLDNIFPSIIDRYLLLQGHMGSNTNIRNVRMMLIWRSLKS